MPLPSRLALVVVGVLGVGTALSLRITAAEASPAHAQGSVAAIAKPIPTRDELLKDFDPRRRALHGSEFTSPLAGDYRAVLTVDPALDDFVAHLLASYEVPYAGFVAVEPSTGRVLAYVSHSSAAPGAIDHAIDASPPAASVFKLVTSSALLEAGVTPRATTCYHGGYSALVASEIVDNPKLDSACTSLKGALGRSINPVFAKLALRYLDAPTLSRYASAFAFGEALPFDGRSEASQVDVPSERLEFARTAAGFWHSHMSPLHAATIAATLANRGRMMRPHVIDRIEDEAGHVVTRSEPALHRAVVERRTAELVGTMMQSTITEGTARKFFFDAKGNPFIPGSQVAGKTGTLSKERPYRGYTWWVGFAPVNEPKIALAALVVNSPKWRIKASYVAREALRHYLVDAPKRAAAKKLSTQQAPIKPTPRAPSPP
jgi:cell division protein FtsI/penicillin-binding protein 2